MKTKHIIFYLSYEPGSFEFFFLRLDMYEKYINNCHTELEVI